jgi:dephospho-CoA kinase
MSYRVGLTGGIGSGKSTVAAIFSELGVPVIDTDLISHQLTQTNGAALPAIRSAFGAAYFDAHNALNRTKLRELIFSQPAAKQQLEQILHPLIFAQAKILAETATSPYILLVIPLLFETEPYRPWLQRTLAVDSAEETQIARVKQRSGLDEATIHAIMAQQIAREQRLQLADDVIQNNGQIDSLQQRVAELNQLYRQLAARSN